MKTLVVDMMGSDNGSPATVEGVQIFLKRHPEAKIIAVGKIEELKALEKTCELIDARDIVPMEAGAMEVMRLRNSSMMVAINTFLDKRADGLVGAGGTGAFLSASTLKLKLIEGVERAALMSPFPTAIKGKKVTILEYAAHLMQKNAYLLLRNYQIAVKIQAVVKNPIKALVEKDSLQRNVDLIHQLIYLHVE